MHKKIVVSMMLGLLLSSVLFAGGKGVAAVEPIVIPKVDVVNTVSDTGLSTWSDRLYNVGLTVGTLGAGLNVATPINDSFQLRLNVNGAQYNRTETQNDIDYDADLKLANVGLLVDYLPFKSVGFHLTAGAYYNANEIDATARPVASDPITINGETYTINDIGYLEAKVDFDKFAPYLGLGWGNDSRSDGFGFSLDIGVLLGKPVAELTPMSVNSLVVNIAQLESDIEAEQASINEDLGDVQVYPVIMLGVTYTF